MLVMHTDKKTFHCAIFSVCSNKECLQRVDTLSMSNSQSVTDTNDSRVVHLASFEYMQINGDIDKNNEHLIINRPNDCGMMCVCC